MQYNINNYILVIKINYRHINYISSYFKEFWDLLSDVNLLSGGQLGIRTF